MNERELDPFDFNPRETQEQELEDTEDLDVDEDDDETCEQCDERLEDCICDIGDEEIF